MYFIGFFNINLYYNSKVTTKGFILQRKNYFIQEINIAVSLQSDVKSTVNCTDQIGR